MRGLGSPSRRAWLALSGIAASALDERVLARFARHRCRCGGSRASDRLSAKYVRRTRRFVRFLGGLGVVPLVGREASVIDPSVARFAEWLRRHRGLSERTIARHVRMISRLLPALGADPGDMTRRASAPSSWTRARAAPPPTSRRWRWRCGAICASWPPRALFGLLAATGLRISEALALRVRDLGEDGLLVLGTKFRKSRLVPIHDTTAHNAQRSPEP
jgi:integrase